MNGVNLWVDTGGLVDQNIREGQVLGTCTDGVDNDGDGRVDGGDGDCLVGDNRQQERRCSPVTAPN